MGEKLLNLALIESLVSIGSLCYAGYRIYGLYKNRKTEKQKPLKVFCYLFFCEAIPIYDFIRWSYRKY